jgi:hypothetical protein
MFAYLKGTTLYVLLTVLFREGGGVGGGVLHGSNTGDICKDGEK